MAACKYGDQFCPCQDGDQCHYEGKNPMTPPESKPADAGWRPISTAPRDGTAILLGSRCGCWIGKWQPLYPSGYKPDNPWSSLMLNHDHMSEKWQTPTHWAPLPPPPHPHD